MTVKEIIIKTASYLNRKDVVEYLKTGATENSEMVKDDVEILLNSYNVVQDEISSLYYKFKATERFSPKNGIIKYSEFSFNPYAILSVKDDFGSKIKVRILPVEIQTEKPITVEYYYIPKTKKIDDICDFTGTPVTDRILSYGIMTEYLLIKGSYEEAGTWHSKYIDALSKMAINGKRLKIKGRVWQ